MWIDTSRTRKTEPICHKTSGFLKLFQLLYRMKIWRNNDEDKQDINEEKVLFSLVVSG